MIKMLFVRLARAGARAFPPPHFHLSPRWMSVALPSSVLFFPPLIVNKARGNDASCGQMDGDVDARHPDAADMSRWTSNLRSCGVCGR